MTSFGRSDGAAEASWQELCQNDWQGLRTLLGQKVLAATHSQQLGAEKPAEGVSQVRLLVAPWADKHDTHASV